MRTMSRIGLMDTLQDQLNKLNNLTGRLLRELERKDLSPESVRRMTDRRQECVDELGRISQSFESNSLSSEERENLKELFDQFIHLDKNLREALHKALYLQQERLTNASQSKEAVKSYNRTSENPDISFF